VLFALRHPAILLGLLIGFLVGVIVRAALQQQLSSGARLSFGRRRLRSVGRQRPATRWATYLDPYGAVAAVIAGVGWGARPPARAGRGAFGLLGVALAVHAALAVAGFAAYQALSGPPVLGHGVQVSDVLHGSLRLGSAGAQVAAGFGMENLACGLLALVPIPPLELGVLLWSRLPRTPGARRIAYHLLEEAWGVAVILVGLLLPLAGQSPALLALLDIVGDPLLRLI
jgi:hypothetical protein